MAENGCIMQSTAFWGLLSVVQCKYKSRKGTLRNWDKEVDTHSASHVLREGTLDHQRIDKNIWDGTFHGWASIYRLNHFINFCLFSPPVESCSGVSSDIKWFQSPSDRSCGGSNILSIFCIIKLYTKTRWQMNRNRTV
jgi:hypothetical protein